jgi:hypothetical protein
VISTLAFCTASSAVLSIARYSLRSPSGGAEIKNKQVILNDVTKCKNNNKNENLHSIYATRIFPTFKKVKVGKYGARTLVRKRSCSGKKEPEAFFSHELSYT